MQLLLATTNEGKIIEISEGLAGLNLSLATLKNLSNPPTQPSESGATFEENAIIKARHYFDAANLPTLADDSGIIVEALGDELGLHTRRWGAGPKASDQEWVEYFLDRMRSEPNKNATFLCHLAYIESSGTLHTFEGRCEGMITETLEADYLPGLPVSACFIPEGQNCVFSALSIEQKNSSSHRGRATAKLKEHLEKIM